ncbi:MAG: hypothetical protein NVS4B8_26890 [Herpetosiphon sp.]
MSESNQASAPQLHPQQDYDQTTSPDVAPGATQRNASDAGAASGSAQGAVETEMTPLTPPPARTAEGATGSQSDVDPADELTPG